MEVREPDYSYTSFTYADYLTWTIPEMVELIKGRVFKMAAAPRRKHQQVAGELFRRISNFLNQKKLQCLHSAL